MSVLSSYFYVWLPEKSQSTIPCTLWLNLGQQTCLWLSKCIWTSVYIVLSSFHTCPQELTYNQRKIASKAHASLSWALIRSPLLITLSICFCSFEFFLRFRGFPCCLGWPWTCGLKWFSCLSISSSYLWFYCLLNSSIKIQPGLLVCGSCQTDQNLRVARSEVPDCFKQLPRCGLSCALFQGVQSGKMIGTCHHTWLLYSIFNAHFKWCVTVREEL